MASTSGTLTLPVLPLDDDAVLPGMVVPLDLSDQDVRAAVEAAQAAVRETGAHAPGIRTVANARKARVLLVPRVVGETAHLLDRRDGRAGGPSRRRRSRRAGP